MSDMDVWMLFLLGFGLGYVAIYLIYNRMQLPKSRCPGCGRWRREKYRSYMYSMSIFECRKCRLVWRDGVW